MRKSSSFFPFSNDESFLANFSLHGKVYSFKNILSSLSSSLKRKSKVNFSRSVSLFFSSPALEEERKSNEPIAVKYLLQQLKEMANLNQKTILAKLRNLTNNSQREKLLSDCLDDIKTHFLTLGYIPLLSNESFILSIELRAIYRRTRKELIPCAILSCRKDDKLAHYEVPYFFDELLKSEILINDLSSINSLEIFMPKNPVLIKGKLQSYNLPIVSIKQLIEHSNENEGVVFIFDNIN